VRFVIFGAGAVGGVIGGRLAQHRPTHGHDVVVVARPAHCAAIRDRGLVINDPAGTDVVEVDAVERIADLSLTGDDIVVISTKTNDTSTAITQLVALAPPDVHIVCAQNGVENERLAARHFANVYAMCVYLPALFLEPGVIDAAGAPHNAMLDVGRYPSGSDDVAETIASACRTSGMPSIARADVMAWKYLKLRTNLANPLDALVGDRDAIGELVLRAWDEADACLAAAGIERADEQHDRARRAGVMEVRPVLHASHPVRGSSTWQSLARGADTTEVDWLNGEIVLLGRLHGVPTPVNTMLCEVMRWAVRAKISPRSLSVDDLIARLDAEGQP
jgi:2-dehydropantoate 2-reductase